MGYTDTILDVRSSRVRSILGLSAVDPHLADTPILNSLSPKGKHSDSDEAERPGSQQAESLSNRVHAQAGSDVIHPTPVRRYVMISQPVTLLDFVTKYVRYLSEKTFSFLTALKRGSATCKPHQRVVL